MPFFCDVFNEFVHLGREVEPNEDAEVELVLGVASGGVRKAAIAVYFAGTSRPSRSR